MSASVLHWWNVLIVMWNVPVPVHQGHCVLVLSVLFSPKHRCGATSPVHYGVFLLLPLTRISINTVNVVVLSQLPPNPSEMITSVKFAGFSTGHISMATERLFFPIRNSDSQNWYIGFASGACGKCKKADVKDLWNSRSNAANSLGCNTIAVRCISLCP